MSGAERHTPATCTSSSSPREGTALFTCYAPNVIGELSIRSAVPQDGAVPVGVVQEVDVATGKLLFQWRSGPARAADRLLHPAGCSPAGLGLLPCQLDHDRPADSNLLISGRNTCAALQGQPQDRQVIWRLGGKHSDFHMGPGTRFAFQHDVSMRPAA